MMKKDNDVIYLSIPKNIYKRLSALTEIIVYGYLYAKINRKKGAYIDTYYNLSKCLDISERSIYRVVQALQKKNLLEVRPAIDSKGRCTVFILR